MAVKAASADRLAAYAIAAAGNAQGLTHDAEVLVRGGRMARTYSLAVAIADVSANGT